MSSAKFAVLATRCFVESFYTLHTCLTIENDVRIGGLRQLTRDDYFIVFFILYQTGQASQFTQLCFDYCNVKRYFFCNPQNIAAGRYNSNAAFI